MSTGLRWTLVGVTALALHAGTGSVATGFPACDRASFGDDAGRLYKEIKDLRGQDPFKDLRGRDRVKALVLERLRRTNQPPVADLELGLVLPRRVDLDASGSTDEDGFPEFYAFQLFDDDTGEVLAGPLTTREPHASLDVEEDLPANLRASVVVEDDEGAIDTTEIAFSPGGSDSCSTAFFHCSNNTLNSITTCTVASGVEEFSTANLLDAADDCLSIGNDTTLVITAAGGAGGRSANEFPFSGAPGGAGGVARLVTTIADLDSTYGSPSEGTTYCYGLGSTGGDTCNTAGAGGASTLLRTCQNVSQTDTTGVLLIAGGGGGGGGGGETVGDGGQGGIALSTTSGPCPPSCMNSDGAGSNAGGLNDTGGRGGAAGTGGASGSPEEAGARGADGIGGKGGQSPWGIASWFQGNPQVIGDTGSGGANTTSGGGAGGGGYGGGGAGTAGEGFVGGGGGGGSYATRSSLAITDLPDANPAAGYLQFSFRL